MLLAKVYDHIKTTVTYQYTVAKMSYVLGLLAGVRPKDFILMTDEDKIFYVHKPLFDYSNQLLDQESKNTLKPLSDYTNQLLDEESKNTLKPLSDYTNQLLDEESKNTLKPLFDSSLPSDVPYKNNQKPLSDYLTFTDYSILNYTINYNDYVNVSEYEIKHFNKVNLDDVQLLDTNPIFVNSKILSDEEILSETVYKNTNLIYSDSISSIDYLNPFIINKTIVEPVLINESIRISLIKSPIYDTQSITDTPYKNPLLKIIETGDGTYVEIGYFETGYISPLTAYDSTPQLSIT